MTHAKRVDTNQREIVDALRQLGWSVETGHDDILVGVGGKTYWFEIKAGKKSRLTESEIKRKNGWRGQYGVITSAEEIVKIIMEAK